MFYVYIGCLTFGTLYAVLSSILGSHGFDHDGGGHIGADHIGADHIGVDVHDGAGSTDADSPSPLNPVVMASAIATFGAAGIIGKMALGMKDLSSAFFASLCAAGVGAAVFFGIVKVLYNSQSNSNFSEDELINLEAEVLVPIPAHGVGEIVYNVNGIRYTLAARSKYNEYIGKKEKVIIQTIDNHTAYITRRMTINDICSNDCDTSLDEHKEDSSTRKNDNNNREV